MVTNITCSRNKAMPTKILSVLEVFIDMNINRKDVETKLVNLKNEVFYVDYRGNTTRLNISLCPEAMDTKYKLNNEAQFVGKCYLSKTNLNFQRSHAYYRFNPISELLICRQVDLDKHEIDIDESTSNLRIKDTNVILSKWKYRRQTNGSARICIETLEIMKRSPHQNDPTLHNILVAASVISMVCLFFTFLTYCIFPSLRSVPGKNNMSLVFSLFLLQSIFTFAGNRTKYDVACKVIGIVLHLVLLSTFTCLSVCTFHMFRTFKTITVPHTKEHSNRTVLLYCLYTYCTPTVVIIINVSITMIIMDDIGYGNRGGICFLLHQYSIIGSLIVPATVICVCNTIFFIVTMYEISSTPKIERTSSHTAVHRNSVVYIKLFSITGITWIFQIADSFLPLTYFSVVASVLNGLQGVYIFLSYTCNKRVLKMYKLLCGFYTEASESTGTRLTTTSPATKVRGVNVSKNPNGNEI